VVSRSDNLIPLLVPPVSGKGLSFSQGVILSWDPDTFENTISWKNITLTNVPVLPSVDALSFEVGAVVGMLGWNPGGGAGSWWILGRINVPPLTDPVAIHGGNLIIDGGGSIIVRDGGDILIQNNGNVIVSGSGEIRSSNFNGDTADEDPGTQGWALGNDLLALAGVFVPAVDMTSDEIREQGFTITTSVVSRATVTVPVPDWAETASVMTTSIFVAVNSSGASRQVHAQPAIAGDLGFSITLTIPDGELFIETIAHARTFNVTALSDFDIEALLWTTSGTIVNASNGATVTALITFRSPQ
jgi:hypothetical protein